MQEEQRAFTSAVLKSITFPKHKMLFFRLHSSSSTNSTTTTHQSQAEISLQEKSPAPDLSSIFLIFPKDQYYFYMYHTSINYLDRLQARNVFQGLTATLLGALATVVLIAGIAAFYIPTIIAYFQGDFYFQSEYQMQQSPYVNLTTAKDFKIAIVFQNKTSNQVANHSLLVSQFLYITSYQMSSTSVGLKYDTAALCKPTYFANTLNPPANFTDCFIFPDYYKIQLSYNPTNGLTNFGFYFYNYCADPFTCITSTASKNASQNNFAAVFANYTYTLYFTSKVLLPNRTFADQVFALTESSFNTPFTISSDSYAEIEVKNTTFDDSILPWFNFKKRTSVDWYGSTVSAARNATITYSLGVRTGLTMSRYQNQVYRFYKKADWLLGIIGGAMFLFFIVLYIPVHFYNSCQRNRQSASQLLIWHTDVPETQTQLRKGIVTGIINGDQRVSLIEVEPSMWYCLKKLLPFYQSREVQQMNRVLDIAALLKKLKVAERNAGKRKGNTQDPIIPLYNKHRQLKIDLEQPKKDGQAILLSNQSNSQIAMNDRVERQQEQVEQELNINEQHHTNPIDNADPPNPNNQNQPHIDDLAQQQPNLIQQNNNANLNTHSQLFNIHPEVLTAIRNSPDIAKLVAVDPTLMAISNQQQSYQLAKELYQYSRDQPKRESCITRISNAVFDFIRWFDPFGVQPQFELTPGGSSIFGCLVGLFIIGSAILFFIFIILNAQNYQNYVQFDFLQPQQINYTVVTGAGFRPFVCFPSGAVSRIISSAPTISFTFFSQTAAGRTTIPAVNLIANQYEYLGISPDSIYYSPSVLNTSNCFVMEQNRKIQMGGYNTSNQGYFGFRVDPYCSGTPSYCASMNATLKANITSFISTYGMTLFLPFNTFMPENLTLGGGGIMPQNIREGNTSISVNSAIQQTFYVDQVQLIDDYTMRFLGIQKPPILQQSITTDRYQSASNIEGINSTMPYYEVRIRPSGHLTKFVLTGTPTDVVLGVIGGITIIFYAVFHCFAKGYNHFCTRAYLAQQIYGQDLYESFFLKKVMVMLPAIFSKCLPKDLKNEIMRYKQVDKSIKYELNQLEMVKQLTAIYHLSTASFSSLQQKYLALIYFKQQVQENQSAKKEDPVDHAHGDFVGDDELESQQDMHRDDHGVANQSVSADSHRSGENRSEANQAKKNKKIQDEVQEVANKIKQNIDQFEPYNPHRSPYSQQTSCLHFFDWFSTKPSFTLNGKTKIKSILGTCLLLAVIACIIILVLYQIKAYENNTNSTISLNKYLIPDAKDQSILRLNSSSYRLAIGFYLSPNSSFLNVSSLLNTSSNLIITVSQVTVIRNSDGSLSQNQTAYPFVPCTSDYFSNFTDKNTDYNFLNGLQNGWCIPLNLTLNLTPIATANYMQYFTMRINSKTNDTTSLNNLRNLTGSYVVGLYMTIPVLDFANRRFINTVRQIRGFPNPTTRAVEYNLTLVKQRIIYTTPNYTLNPPRTVVSSYTYLNNKNNERTYQATNTSLTRTYNITASYLGLVEEYTYVQPNPNQIVGVIGGLIVLFCTLALVITQSFNTYKYRYLVGKQLFLVTPAKTDKFGKPVKKVDLQPYDVDYNQLQLFIYWLLSFLFCNCQCFRPLRWIAKLQEKADEELNLGQFYVKLAQLRDTFNSHYKLQGPEGIKVSNLIAKLPLFQANEEYQLVQSHKDFIRRHGLSSFDQQILQRARNNRDSFLEVYPKDAQLYYSIFYNQQNQHESEKFKIQKELEIASPHISPYNPLRSENTKLEMSSAPLGDNTPSKDLASIENFYKQDRLKEIVDQIQSDKSRIKSIAPPFEMIGQDDNEMEQQVKKEQSQNSAEEQFEMIDIKSVSEKPA